ncbi:MAG: LVIVD repeat-containing protein [Terriglobales bacterium]
MLAVLFAICVCRSVADDIPQGWTASNMEAIGYSDLEGRGGAFKMAIKEVNGRWYLYLGHLWNRGWSIVEVTEPASPRYVKFVPWPQDNTSTKQVDLHDNLLLTGLQGIPEAWGGVKGKRFDEGLLLWDISDPVNPKLLSHWKTGAGQSPKAGTHRNVYPGGKYAYLAAGMPGFRGDQQILVILDVSDPKNPKEAGRWWMPGQKDDEPHARRINFHGAPVVDGNMAYMAYGPGIVILDISDVSRPKVIGQIMTSPLFKRDLHSVLLLPNKMLFASNEAVEESCDASLSLAALFDVKDPRNPQMVANLPIPVPPKDTGYRDFCEKGGRFGPHNTNSEYHLPAVQPQGKLIYLTYFNAGLRVFDIENPRIPKEVAWFIPPQPTKRLGPQPTTKLVTQTEDVLVDRRGNIYITDKQWGLFVLRSKLP